METFIIDRFEGDFAVLEDARGAMRDVRRDQLPLEAAQGDLLRYENGAFRIDARATAERRAQIEKLMKELLQ